MWEIGGFAWTVLDLKGLGIVGWVAGSVAGEREEKKEEEKVASRILKSRYEEALHGASRQLGYEARAKTKAK